MGTSTRRAFLGSVGAGALLGTVGAGVAGELGLLGRLAFAEDERLDFGEMEPLVRLMQETEADELLGRAAAELSTGTELATLVSAAALANARTFGGEDYTGYHCFMALIPALEMSKRCTGAEAALPVLKVLHRNARRIQEKGGRSREVLRPVHADDTAGGDAAAELLAVSRAGHVEQAEARLSGMVARDPDAAYAALQPITRDNIDVHQVVLTFRSRDMMRLAGRDNAETLLRQTLRQCIDREQNRRRGGRAAPSIRALLPRLIADHGLDRERTSVKRLGDEEVASLARFLFIEGRDAAAEYAAARLADGAPPEDVGEALSMAGALLLLHDPGKERGAPGKPIGSVHGASVGLHACDSANAWRGIAAATDASIGNASLVTGAWHTAGQSRRMDPAEPHHASGREDAAALPPDELLGAVGEAVRGGDQIAAAALAERYGATGGDAAALIDLLLVPAIDHDGALHHEKFFLTATEEFARSRPAHRWVHLVALTRVMASGSGFEAPGVAEAKALLGA